jgi:hypothetical protein
MAWKGKGLSGMAMIFAVLGRPVRRGQRGCCRRHGRRGGRRDLWCPPVGRVGGTGSWAETVAGARRFGSGAGICLRKPSLTVPDRPCPPQKQFLAFRQHAYTLKHGPNGPNGPMTKQFPVSFCRVYRGAVRPMTPHCCTHSAGIFQVAAGSWSVAAQVRIKA